ncbi:MAG: hypothetical protein RRC34_08220 [Lentisphaeria bacterium]|nr:hypothetical protein [Lentisphaeria bacterium]
MSDNLVLKLTGLLKTDPRFVDEDGELVKSAVIDRAWRTDHDLVALLLSDAAAKAAFFAELT